jgi:hypothetical protein
MPLSPLTVIVVDDDVDIRRAVGRSLRRMRRGVMKIGLAEGQTVSHGVHAG